MSSTLYFSIMEADVQNVKHTLRRADGPVDGILGDGETTSTVQAAILWLGAKTAMTATAVDPSRDRDLHLQAVSVAWVTTVLVSSVPDIAVREFFGRSSVWLFRGQMLLLVLCLVVSFVRPVFCTLRRFFVMFLALYSFEWGIGQISHSAGWSYFRGTLTRTMNGSQLLKFGVGLAMAAVIVAMTRSLRASFLRLSAPRAMVRPVWYLPIRRPVRYTRFAPLLALVIASGTLAFVLLAGHPSTSVLRNALPLLPLVIVWAAMNAFSEEYSFRASLIASLRNGVGDQQALLLSAFYFGVAHFYGIPYGLLGVIMAACLGYLLGRALLDTQGMLWPWFIHFVQDLVIFAFLAIGSITPAGT
jgi:membrane protease YdiL (CAAX protease family)